MESARCDCPGNCTFLGVKVNVVPQEQTLF